ncbi:MAG: ribosome maturation factor RimP [Eubacterium sp.]|nr:ribosome maturation factor RimP [Eubacterium sp.]
MSAKTEMIESRAEALIQPVIEENQFELVDVEYVKEAGEWYLRAYIDKPGGVTVDDCEKVSRAFEARLDEADLIADAYILEVSSPGLDRPLKKEKDYRRAMGKEIELHTYKPVDGEKQFFGTLQEFDADSVTIRTEEEQTRTFLKKDLALIRMAVFF